MVVHLAHAFVSYLIFGRKTSTDTIGHKGSVRVRRWSSLFQLCRAANGQTATLDVRRRRGRLRDVLVGRVGALRAVGLAGSAARRVETSSARNALAV